MPSTKRLDLTDTVSFLSLLKCQKELAHLAPGETLVVTTNDPDMLNDLIKIVDRSSDRVLERSMNGEHFSITIGRGIRET